MASVYVNLHANAWRTDVQTDRINVLEFHKKLPQYEKTPLISLEDLAQKMGVKEVFLKYEGSRLGLNAFKILGASWAVFQAISKQLGLDATSHHSSIEALADKAKANDITIATASQGNHGMAVAKMCQLLGVKSRVYIPQDGSSDVESNLRALGAAVVRCLNLDYDGAVLQACQDAKDNGHILVQDTSWEGYEEIPAWIVDGYSTILAEVDEQLNGKDIDIVVTPVGVGSLAHAVVRHCKSRLRVGTRVLTVEPGGAACLYNSLTKERLVSVKTQSTIMAGMNCGTVSLTAWETLRQGVDASTTISDTEAEESLSYLKDLTIEAGPCGAATLAGLLKASPQLGLDEQSIIVLICSEGPREYQLQ